MTPLPRSRFLPFFGALVLALLVLALPAQAGNGIWTPLGPDSGTVTALALDPSNPDVLYAGTDWSGVFKSTDGGATWRASSAGMGAGGRGIEVNAVAVDPLRPGTLFAATIQHGLFKSLDAGRTWSAASAGLPPGAHIADLVFEAGAGRRAPRRLWAATSRGLFATADGGATWKPAGKGFPGGAVWALEVHPAAHTLYAGLDSGGVYRSDNRGAAWYPAGRGLPGKQAVVELAVDPTDPDFLVASTREGVYRTIQRGRKWARSETGTPRGLLALAFDASGGRIYGGGFSTGLLVSVDRGATWTRFHIPDDDILALAAAPDALYAGTLGQSRPGGVFRSLDGRIWTLGRGLSTLQVWSVIASPDSLYVNALDVFGISRSDDRGATWRDLDLGLPPNTWAQLLAYDPRNPATVYATTTGPSHLRRSDDRGNSWIGIPRTESWGIEDLAFDLRGPERGPDWLWAGGPAGLFHSEDGGHHWARQPIDQGFWLWDVEPHPLDPEVVYAVGTAYKGVPSFEIPRIARTLDGGRTWKILDENQPFPGGTVVDLALDPEDVETLHIAMTHGLFRSTDGGLTWEPVPELPGSATAVAAAPGGVVYAANDLGEVLFSEDGGETWASIRRGLGWRIVSWLEVDPADPRRVFAGTRSGGVHTWSVPTE